MTETNLYRIYYNQRTTEVVASSFEMAFASEKSWYSKETILFVENVNTSEIRKFIVQILRQKSKIKIKNVLTNENQNCKMKLENEN